MRYVPILIPEKSKVLNDYFKGSIHSTKSSNSFRFFFRMVRWFDFLAFCLVSLIHPLLSILFGFIGFMLILPGHNWIEKKFKFRLTTKIKSIFASGLFLFSIPLLAHYDTIYKQEAHQLKLKTDQEEKARDEVQKEEQIRSDSLIFYINSSSDLANKHKTDEALKKSIMLFHLLNC